MPSWLMPASRQRSRCFSTISRRPSRRSCGRRPCSTRPAARGSRPTGSRAAFPRRRRSTPARTRTTCQGRRGSWPAVARVRRAVGSSTSHIRARRSSGPGRGRSRPASGRSRSRCPRPAGSSCRRSPRAGAPRASGTLELLDLRLAAQVGHRLVAVEPDVLELELSSSLTSFSSVDARAQKKTPGLEESSRPHCLDTASGGVLVSYSGAVARPQPKPGRRSPHCDGCRRLSARAALGDSVPAGERRRVEMGMTEGAARRRQRGAQRR